MILVRVLSVKPPSVQRAARGDRREERYKLVPTLLMYKEDGASSSSSSSSS